MRNWKTKFIEHGLDRLNLRLSVSEEWLAEQLDTDHAVSIGKEKETDRVSRLFFSLEDDGFFVAIQDMSNGEVITILPTTYWLNLNIKTKGLRNTIGQIQLKKALKFWEGHPQPIEFLQHLPSPIRIPNNKVSTVHFQGMYLANNHRITGINLDSMSLSDIKLLTDKELLSKLFANIKIKLSTRNVDIHRLISMRWSLGKDGNSKDFNFVSTEGLWKALSSIIECAKQYDRDFKRQQISIDINREQALDFNRKLKLQRALLIQEKAHGAEHPAIIQYLSSLALHHEKSGSFQEAISLLERGLAIKAINLRPGGVTMVNSLKELASLYHAIGDHDKVKLLLNRAQNEQQERLRSYI